MFVLSNSPYTKDNIESVDRHTLLSYLQAHSVDYTDVMDSLDTALTEYPSSALFEAPCHYRKEIVEIIHPTSPDMRARDQRDYFFSPMPIDSIKLYLDPISDCFSPNDVLQGMMRSPPSPLEPENSSLIHRHIIEQLYSKGARVESLMDANAYDIASQQIDMIGQHYEYFLHNPHAPVSRDTLARVLLSTPFSYTYRDGLMVDTAVEEKRQQVLQKILGEDHSSLTIYHDAAHAFFKIACGSCLDGKATSITVGLYPPSREGQTEENNDGESEKETVGSVEAALEMVRGNIIGLILAPIRVVNANRMQITDYDRYDMHIEDYSLSYDKDKHAAGYPTSAGTTFEEIPHRVFNISSDRAADLVNYVHYLDTHCDQTLQYRILSMNCFQFIQTIYERAGLEGDHFEQMYPDGNYPETDIGYGKIACDTYQWVKEIVDYFSYAS